MDGKLRVFAALLLLGATAAPARADVAIWTGSTSWIDVASATAQAQICAARLEAIGIPTVVYSNVADETLLADFVAFETDDGDFDAVILFGYLPPALYPAGNAMPDDSLIEQFIESEDGDAVINHADWMFYVSATNNAAAGLQNIMDVPAANMAGFDNTPMIVTAEGRSIAPSLRDFSTDRPMHLGTLGGEWVVEATLAENAAGTHAEPVILRDGPRGRIIPIYQTNAQVDPKGAVAAEVIAWLAGEEIEATLAGVSGEDLGVTGTPTKLLVSVQDDAGYPTGGEDATIALESDSDTGAFDTSIDGAFDGSVTSVSVPAGQAVAVFYRDSTPGFATITASVSAGPDVDEGTHTIELLEDLSGDAGEVAIWTGTTNWITKPAADVEAQNCADKLDLLGVDYQWFQDPLDDFALSDWMIEATDNGAVDVLILYGYFPGTIYAPGNGEPDGSVAELFIESTDGDVIINHADWMFYVSSTNNGTAGLQNMMDIPGVTMAGFDNLQMLVTPEGRAIAPSLGDFLTDRPLHLDTLDGQWFVEVSLATGLDPMLADPVIVRDGNRGRIVPMFQANAQNDPKGAVSAEVVAYFFDINLGDPTRLGVTGAQSVLYPGQTLALGAEVQDFAGSPSTVDAPVVIELTTNSATGAFDIAPNGAFDGSVTTVTVPAGASSAPIYYRDTAAGTPTITLSADGLSDGSRQVTILERTYAPPGEVAIWTGTVNWISKTLADEQAELSFNRLDASGVTTNWFFDPLDDLALAEWVEEKTGNGELDVLILYGYFPGTIYGPGNAEPDGSLAELFIESTDGDAIINHGDWMFYVSSTNNGVAGLQNMMDVPGVTMAGNDNLQMTVTARGQEIAPSLGNFLTDRPLHLNTLGGDWLVEELLASNPDGSLADPVIVRDGDRGRIIPVFQAADQNDPKGAVAAEIVSFLFDTGFDASLVGFSGSTSGVTGTPVKLRVGIRDGGGIPVAQDRDVTIELATDSGTGAFDTDWGGDYDGSVTTVTLPAGQTTAIVYYVDSSEGTSTLTASVAALPDLDPEPHDVTLAEDLSGPPGEVAIWTGTVNWIDKALADAEAQVTANMLDAAGVSYQWFQQPTDDFALADWVADKTDNGEVDVLVLYGYFPGTIYGPGNAEPDGSIAEAFIESTDGDAIINHADWMFYVSSTVNGTAGLQNMMDIPGVTMAGNDNLPVTVTDQGAAIAPSLVDFQTDRPLHLETLTGDWFVEAALAENVDGTLAEPVIVRDGNRGRIIPCHQTFSQDDPKGEVAAEIILYVLGSDPGTGGDDRFVRGDADSSGQINLTDGVVILLWNFQGGEAPACFDAADTDDSGTINLTDPVIIFQWLFLGGQDPAQPSPSTASYPSSDCGPDPTDDELGACVVPPPCAN